MAILTVSQNGIQQRIPFDGTPLLDEVLNAAGLLSPHPCGGLGKCGKCAVQAEGALAPMTASEERFGTRLSCQTRLLGDATVTLPDDRSATMHIETETAELSAGGHGFGAAVDIGTTTVAVKLYDLESRCCIGQASAPNPQISTAADVMGRIEAAMSGQLTALRDRIREAVHTLLLRAAPNGHLPSPLSITLTGNTTMLYLLCGYDPTPLSRAPFRADHLFGTHLLLPPLEQAAYLPPCMNAFVGADITCAILAAGMCEREETALLCDIGTNGELALWKNGRLYVTSTAAGPAFEGAGIVCGCGSVAGAIDRVWLENGKIRIHTIGDAAPTGLCGSGVLDAVAVGLQTGEIDESGAMEEPMILAEGIALYPRDVRAVQLAKAAIAAGIDTLAERADIDISEIRTLYIAGGFGSHLDCNSAADIGLLPRVLTERTRILGNAALTGAAMTLTDPQAHERLAHIASLAAHINLGGDPSFSEHYIDRMIFGDEE